MMFWYWQARIYNANGQYWTGQIMTGRNLNEIDAIQEFYHMLTGCKMVLEGMSEQEYANITPIREAFEGLWAGKLPLTN